MLTADDAHLVSEERVGYTDDETFGEEGPVQEGALADHGIGDGLGLCVFVAFSMVTTMLTPLESDWKMLTPW